jgi:CRP-like cAMP-binding protein
MEAIVNPNNKKFNKLSRENTGFDAQAFLDSAGVARKVQIFKKTESVYSQGDAARSVMYLQEGSVKLTVVSGSGKEAVVAILRPGDFFGEGCLAGQPRSHGNGFRRYAQYCADY